MLPHLGLPPRRGRRQPGTADLGLPGDLASDLDRWSDDFDAIFPPDDPGAAAFASPEEEQAFYDRGLRLARRVADAVGDRYEVTYRGRISDTETSLS